jgi:hypothetical protein
VPRRLILCGNPSSLDLAGATLVGRIQLAGLRQTQSKEGKFCLAAAKPSIPARGLAIYGVLGRTAGSSFVGLAEISAQLGGRKSGRG